MGRGKEPIPLRSSKPMCKKVTEKEKEQQKSMKKGRSQEKMYSKDEKEKCNPILP